MQCSKLRFLVVEDHEFQRNMLVQTLRNLGAEAVHAASNGASALLILADPERQIDIVITDLAMPGMDGSTLVRHLGETGSGIALVLLSAAGTDRLAAASSLAAASHVRVLGTVLKPLTARKLQSLMERFRAAGRTGDPQA
jgi:CheY-like chemotaxis protein